MDKNTSKNLLLLTIFVIAFTYRLALMTMNIFPPGADIGLHESVIKSITSGKTNFFWNYYHMGGGLSVTNPGYHIFASFIIAMTGASDYLVQAAVASCFSALLVLCAFLVVRQVWSESAGFVVAILVTFSASDIVILSWSGYPNVIALTLIPLVFYLFLRSPKPSSSYLAVTSILIGAIFLTHTFSAFIFLGITVSTLFLSSFFSKKTGLSKKRAFMWLVPIVLGVLLVSPYLINTIPIYFGPEGALTGSVAVMRQAVLETRQIPVNFFWLSIIPVFMFFLFSKYQKGKFVSLPAVLFASWILVPLVATQSYLLGVYLDYERFLYFLSLPIIVCVGLIIVNSPKAISRATQIFRNSIKLKINAKLAFKLSKKTSTAILLTILVLFTLVTPLFALPNVGASQVNFFQVIKPSEYEAIQWINTNTPVGSVFVADAEFGWWVSGFAERPTLSAVDPQFLILQHEFEPASVASNLLTTDYLLDNGLIQVKQAGANALDDTHEILAVLNDSYIHPQVFSINDTMLSVLYRDNGAPKQLSLAGFTNSKTHVKSNPENASFLVARENQLLSITEEITVYKGVNFAKISFTLQNKTSNVNFDWLHLPFQSRGFPLQYANSIAVVDNTMHVMSQVVFPERKLGSDVFMQEHTDFYELIYNMQGKASAEISFFVGLCQFNPDSENTADYWNSLIESNSKSYLDKISDQALNCFDYQDAIKDWNISYIALRDFGSIPRFNDDPMFTLVFKNDKVAIFKVANIV